MALMKFREPNQVKWQGVRPGHNGEQVSKWGSADNGISAIHTVTAGKTLYLCTAILSYAAVAAGKSYIYYRDDADLNPVYFATEIIVAADSARGLSFTFWPPIEIPAGYDICIRSNAAGLTVAGYCFGWEE